MLIPQLSLTLVLATLTTALSINTTSQNPSLLNNFPNLYPVPGTAVTLEFDPSYHKLISESDVVACIRKARREIGDHIHDHGDGPLPMDFDEIVYETAALGLYPTGNEQHPLLYSDGLAVLKGFETKFKADRYRDTSASVLRTVGGAYIGESEMVGVEDRGRMRGILRGG